MALLEKELTPQADAAAPYERRLWTRDEYYKMAEAGILGPDERVELIEGEVFQLAPIGPGHRNRGLDLYDILRSLVAADQSAMYKSPVVLANGSEPQPDILVATGPRSDYEDHHPEAADILVIVEVSHNTLNADRRFKLPLYASAGIPEYWIVNLVERQVEIYREPSDGDYSNRAIYKSGQTIDLTFAAGKSIAVDDFLPKSP